MKHVAHLLFPHRHLLGIQQLSVHEINLILELAEPHVDRNRQVNKSDALIPLAGRTIINLFFEPSTRTRVSFEIAAKRLGADVINLSNLSSSSSKGETLLDTVATLNAMHPDVIIMRHPDVRASTLVADAVNCSVISAGDGAGEHPTQALLDALTILNHKGRIAGLNIALCGDIKHSRVAQSNVLLLTKLGANVKLIAPPALIPIDAIVDKELAVYHSMEAGLVDCDVVMMLRLQKERWPKMRFNQSIYTRKYRLDHKKLALAKPDALVMHPGPMNRGVEITDLVADSFKHSVIREQVEMGVAVRMACLELLTRHPPVWT